MPFAWIPISLTNFFNVSTLEREVSEAEGLNGTGLSFLTNTKQLFGGSVLRMQCHSFCPQEQMTDSDSYLLCFPFQSYKQKLIFSLFHLRICIFMYSKYSSVFQAQFQLNWPLLPGIPLQQRRIKIFIFLVSGVCRRCFQAASNIDQCAL